MTRCDAVSVIASSDNLGLLAERCETARPERDERSQIAVVNGGFRSRAHGTLETMAFTVYLSSDEGINHGYGDKDRYELSAAGTLVVRPADGTQTYTYAQWVYLKADTDHTAGGPKSGSGKATFI